MRSPPRILVILYLATARLSLALAFGLVAWNPSAVAGFFYHPRLVAVVHLITIGWIGMSILGSLYIVAPAALQMSFPARKADYAAYACVAIGLVGIVAHFWIEEFGGMAWSALTAACGILYVVTRFALGLGRSRIDRGVKLHLYFASLNIVAAAGMGVLLGFDKSGHFLPGYVVANVLAHAHMAAVGWAGMMVVGLGFCLLPMMIPSETPSRRAIHVGAVAVETGVVGIFLSLIVQSRWTFLFASILAVGLVGFAAHVAWMLRHPTAGPHARPEPDYAVRHITAAVVSLLLAIALGSGLLLWTPSDWTLRAALAYGVLGLVGFLAQAVLGFDGYFVPVAARYCAVEPSKGEAGSHPHSGSQYCGSQSCRAAVFALWTIGVPVVAAGFFLDVARLLGMGSWLLFGAVTLSSVDTAAILSRPSGSSLAGARWFK